MENKMPDEFIIVGSQKSASTFVQACLEEHPEIFMPSMEVSFFESPDYEEQSVEDLQKLFVGRTEKVLGFKRPSYIGKPEVPERIRNHCPTAKLIAVLRNPVDRAVSAYYHNINYGFIPPLEIEEGMNLLLDGAYEKIYRRAHEIIEFGFYYKYLKLYQHFFDNDLFMVLLHEDIISDKLSAIQKIYSFLNVHSSYIPKAINSRPQAVLYSIPRLRVLSLRNQFLYEYNSDRTRLFAKKQNTSTKEAAALITEIDDKYLSKMFVNEKPNLSKDLGNRLYNIYSEDVEKLQAYIGRDLGHWKFQVKQSEMQISNYS